MSEHHALFDPAQSGTIRLPDDAFTGETMLRLVSAAVQSDAVSVNHLTFAAGARSRPHSHDSDQLIFYTKGDGVIAVDGGEDVLVPEGTFVMLRKHVIHMHGAADTGPAEHISIMPTGHSTDFRTPIPDAWSHWAPPEDPKEQNP